MERRYNYCEYNAVIRPEKIFGGPAREGIMNEILLFGKLNNLLVCLPNLMYFGFLLFIHKKTFFGIYPGGGAVSCGFKVTALRFETMSKLLIKLCST